MGKQRPQSNALVRDFFNKNASVYDAKTNEYITQKRADFLRDFIKGRVLDIGVGSGRLAAQYGAEKLVGIDTSIGMLQVAKGRLSGAGLIVADAEVLPVQSQSFDTLICSEVIYYLNAPQKFLQEAARVLNAKGRFILLWGNRKFNPLYKAATFLGLRGDDPHSLQTTSKSEIEAWVQDIFPNTPKNITGLGWSKGLDHFFTKMGLDFHPVDALIIDKEIGS